MAGKDVAEGYLRRAQAALEDARALVVVGRAVPAVARGYDAIHDGSRALVVLHNEVQMRPLRTAQDLQRLALAGKVPQDLADTVSRLHRVSFDDARANEPPVSVGDAREFVRTAEEFVARIRRVSGIGDTAWSDRDTAVRDTAQSGGMTAHHQ
jgi:hypothetical protein